MDKITGVYLILNKETGKRYVGSSIDIRKRWASHRSPSTWIKLNNKMYQDFQIYGLDNFAFIVLEECEPSELKKREAFWVEELKCITNGYNEVIPFRAPEEIKSNYKVWKDKYNHEHKAEHTEYMRNYRKRA